MMKEYGWQDWISDNRNRKLYDENPQRALREYNEELGRRAKLAEFYEAKSGVTSNTPSAVSAPAGGSAVVESGPDIGYGFTYNWVTATDARLLLPAPFQLINGIFDDTCTSSARANEDRGTTQLSASLSEAGLTVENLLTNGNWPEEPNWDGDEPQLIGDVLQLVPGYIAIGTGDQSKLSNRAAFHTNGCSTTGPNILQINTNGSINVAFGTTDDYGANVVMMSYTDPGVTQVADNDGNIYPVAQVGSLWFITRPLKTTTFMNGDPIPLIESADDWNLDGTPKRAFPNYDPTLPI